MCKRTIYRNKVSIKIERQLKKINFLRRFKSSVQTFTCSHKSSYFDLKVSPKYSTLILVPRDWGRAERLLIRSMIEKTQTVMMTIRKEDLLLYEKNACENDAGAERNTNAFGRCCRHPSEHALNVSLTCCSLG